MFILTIACLIMLGMIIESFFPIKNVANKIRKFGEKFSQEK